MTLIPGLPSTISPDTAVRRLWDVVVIGAGPAGTTAGALLARRGLDVLIVERSALPREKVCGGCVSAAALGALRAARLDDALEGVGAPALRETIILDRGRRTIVPLRGGVAVSRRTLDGRLAAAAVRAGAHLLTGVSATATHLHEGRRRISALFAGGRFNFDAKVVLLAGGLSARLGGDGARLATITGRRSRIGVGTMVRTDVGLAPGQILMACSRHGYVGMTLLESGLLNVAAAVEPESVRRAGGTIRAVQGMLREAGAPVPELEGTEWRGTPRLTRRVSPVALPRLLVAGDAAGYVEPFTGEGIAWAISGGAAAAALAEAGAADWRAALEREWADRHGALIGSRQGMCRAIAWSLRRGLVRRAGLAAGRAAPGLGRLVTSRLQRPYDIGAACARATAVAT